MEPALSQSNPSPETSTSQGAESDDESNYSLYKRFLDTFETNPTAAFKVANEYLRRFPQDNRQGRFLREWINDYISDWTTAQKLLLEKVLDIPRYDVAFALCRDILILIPDDVQTLHTLSDIGVAVLSNGNIAFNADAINYARKALKLIESGQVPDNNGKIRGKLYLNLGLLTRISDPAESEVYIAKAMQFDDFRTGALAYSMLADVLSGAQYNPLFTDYHSRFPTPEQQKSAEAKQAKVRMNRAADEVVDALALAVALAGSDRALAPKKTLWMEKLTQLYTSRNSGYDTGLTEVIEGILERPSPAQTRPR